MPSENLSPIWDLIPWNKPTVSAWKGMMQPSVNLPRPMGRVLCIMGLVVFTGCATAYTPPALTTQHPAHPEAEATPTLPASTTLAYTSADILSPRPAVAPAPHGMPGASPSAQQDAETAVGEGRVVAVVPESSEIVVAHGEIKGFMDAMTMGYPIQPPSLLEGVQAGDSVRFTIDTERKAIVQLEKLPQ